MPTTDDAAPDVETPDDDRLPTVEDDRYSTFDVEDGSTVIFDREADDAWLQGDCAVDLRP
jgi:hypothetical protein